MILQANGIQRKACVAIFISDKNKFYHRITDKDEHFLMIKGILQQEDITLLNTYAPNQGALKQMKQLLTKLKRKTGKNTIIVGDLNISLTVIARPSKQKINKEMIALNDTLDQWA